jgi:hypothetical protein
LLNESGQHNFIIVSESTNNSDKANELYTIRASDGVEYGPCNLEEVKELVKQGRVKATTMVYTQTAGRWHLAASVPEVRAFLRKYNPSQDSALNKIRSLGSNVRDSAHALRAAGRMSTIRIKNSSLFNKIPFWKKLFGGGSDS